MTTHVNGPKKYFGLGGKPFAVVLALCAVLGLGGAFAMAAAFDPPALLQGADWVRHVLLDKFLHAPQGDDPGRPLPGGRQLYAGGLDGGLAAAHPGPGLGGPTAAPLYQTTVPPLVGTGPIAYGPVNGPVSQTAPTLGQAGGPYPALQSGGSSAPAPAGGSSGGPPTTLAVGGGTGNVTPPPAVVPLPGAVWLLGSGLAALALPGLRARRRC
jgi:hypothetical protein